MVTVSCPNLFWPVQVSSLKDLVRNTLPVQAQGETAADSVVIRSGGMSHPGIQKGYVEKVQGRAVHSLTALPVGFIA